MDALFSLFHKPHARVQIPIEADLFPLNLNIQLDQYVSWVHGPNFIKVYAFKLKKHITFLHFTTYSSWRGNNIEPYKNSISGIMIFYKEL